MVQEKLVSSEKTKNDNNVYHDEPQLQFDDNSLWEEYQFEELFEIKNGLNKGKDYFGYGIPILNYMDVNKNIYNTKESIKGLVDVDKNEIKRYNVKPNDLFFTRTSETSDEIGLTSAYTGELMDCVFSGFILRARPIKEDINSLFFAYYLRSDKSRSNIIKYSSITTRALISGSNLYKMKVRMPKIDEQNKIAGFLSAIDKKIELLEKKHETYEKFYIYVLNKIFKKELSFSTSNTWKEATLGELGVFFRGHSYNSSNVVNEGLVVLRSNNIQNSKLIFEKDQLQQVNKDCKEEIKLLKNDIVICMSNGTKSLVGKSAMYEGNFNKELTVGAFCSIFRSSFPLSKYLLKTSLYKRNLYLILAGTNINNLKNEDMKKFKFEIPTDAEEINKIDGFLKNLENNLNKINYELSSIKNFKAGLLQKMFV